MDLQEVGWRVGGWAGLGRMEGACEHCDQPLGSIKCTDFLD